MWALRRASVNLKNRGLSSGIARICCAKSQIPRCVLENYNASVEPHADLLEALVHSTRSYNTSSSSSNSYREVRAFSSKAADDESMSESELSDGDSIADDVENNLETLESEADAGEKISSKTRGTSAITTAILAGHASPVSDVLDKWVEAGNEVTRSEVSLTMANLRNRRMFSKALQFLEWLESTKRLEYQQNSYASRLDLIAKVRSIYHAEEYIKQIPESSRDEIVYRTLLANYVATGNVKKSEDLFDKMKSLFPITCFCCNQMLLLYKRTDKRKIADVLSLMEKEKIKPSDFTYHLLIEVKGQFNDISGMEQIVETMKSEGVEPNTKIHVSLAQNYVAAGLKDKAKAVLKEMEGGDLTKNRWSCRYLLPIYASLGSEDEVKRIWKVCESNPREQESMAAIEAWGQLKRVEDAESVFNQMMKKLKKPASKHFASLIKIYADNKLLDKGKELVQRMTESGCSVGPLTWDALVKLYVGAGEVEKAHTLLENAIKQRRGKPLCSTYLTILDGYANRGDVPNAERTFIQIRRAGYASRIRPYRALIYAYINAKAPAYGFRERMKGDNVTTNVTLNNLLVRADAIIESAFRKSAVTNLLE